MVPSLHVWQVTVLSFPALTWELFAQGTAAESQIPGLGQAGQAAVETGLHGTRIAHSELLQCAVRAARVSRVFCISWQLRFACWTCLALEGVASICLSPVRSEQ